VQPSSITHGKAAGGGHAPDDRADRALLDPRKADLAARYVSAWEAGDIEAVVSMLTDEATHAMPPWAAWFAGRDTLRRLYASYEIWDGRPRPGLFRVLPLELNGDLGFAEYCRSAPDRPYEALALTIATLDPAGSRIADKVSFVSPDLFGRMGLPRTTD